MARRRFFVQQVRRDTAELTGSDAEHLVRVLRAEVGQVYELSDNRDLYLARIEIARKSVVSFRILEKLDSPIPTVHVSLVAALIKFDRFEWLVEKATELGVSLIQPFGATRTDPGLLQASHKRRARWEKIALEASQQSRRVHLPQIEPAVRFPEALEIDANIKLLLDETSDGPPILERLPEQRSSADRVALLLGPEGGWTDQERLQAVEAGWLSCSLGTTTLRAETAGIAALAVIQAAWSRRIT
jgi:16S rRNA (uracil1498-N3)-methyltransferase